MPNGKVFSLTFLISHLKLSKTYFMHFLERNLFIYSTEFDSFLPFQTNNTTMTYQTTFLSHFFFFNLWYSILKSDLVWPRLNGSNSFSTPVLTKNLHLSINYSVIYQPSSLLLNRNSFAFSYSQPLKEYFYFESFSLIHPIILFICYPRNPKPNHEWSS